MYSSGSRYTSGYGSSISIALPASMPAGAVIGRGGQNIKMLQQRSGARVSVSKTGKEVVISGSSSDVQAAKKLLELQIDAFLSSGGGYPHPLQVHYLLAQAYGNDATCRVAFRPRQDEVAKSRTGNAAGRREQLYELQPAAAAPRAGGGDETELGALAQRLTSVRLASVVAHMLDAAGMAIRHTPAFDDMKLRLNFGKSLWYNGLFGSSWSIQEMRSKDIPGDFKSVFSNCVLPQQLFNLQSWLPSQGFTLVEAKQRVSVHLLHLASSSSYGFSFIKNTDGSLVLRKAKTGNSKLFFLTLLGKLGEPDSRAKLLAQYQLKQDSEMHNILASVASSARQARPDKLHFPNLAVHDMTVDKERHKSKTIYQGSFSSSNRGSSPTLIKVTVSKVLGGIAGGASFEVAGTSPHVNELLQSMLRNGKMDCQAELTAHINNILAFAEKATAVMAAA